MFHTKPITFVWYTYNGKALGFRLYLYNVQLLFVQHLWKLLVEESDLVGHLQVHMCILMCIVFILEDVVHASLLRCRGSSVGNNA